MLPFIPRTHFRNSEVRPLSCSTGQTGRDDDDDGRYKAAKFQFSRDL